jgi:hypothetical protein
VLGVREHHHTRTGRPTETRPCASLESEAPSPDDAHALILGITERPEVTAIRLAEERGGPVRSQVPCRA